MNDGLKEPASPDDTPDRRALAEQQSIVYARELAFTLAQERANSLHLEAAYSTLEAIFHQTPVGLLIADEGLQVERVNSTLVSWFDSTTDAFLNRSLLDVIPSPLLKDFFQPSAPSAGSVELYFQVPRELYLRATVRLVEVKTIKKWVLVIQDETGRRKSDRRKAMFLTLLSHELRTPLNTIAGFASLLSDDLAESADEGKRSLLDCIIEGTTRLSGICEELTTLSHLFYETSSPFLAVEVELNTLVSGLSRELQAEAETRGVEIRNAIPPGTRLTVVEGYLARALLELIRNGILFREAKGFVNVEFEARDDEFVISVSDDGLGINDADLKRIFEPFVQLEDVWSRQFPGLGIGLAIAEKAAEALGGSIEVASAPQKGSTFSIVLPNDRVPIAKHVGHFDALVLASATAGRHGLVKGFQQLYPALRQSAMDALAILERFHSSKLQVAPGIDLPIDDLLVLLGKKLELTEDEVNTVTNAIHLRGIGMLSMPSSMQPAIEAEAALVGKQVERASLAGLMELIRAFTLLAEVREDGLLRGSAVTTDSPIGGTPLTVKVLTVVEAYLALCTGRPYRMRCAAQEAVAQLQQGAGRYWDERVVKVFVEVLSEVSTRHDGSKAADEAPKTSNNSTAQNKSD